MKTSKTSNKRAIKALPALRASLLWYKRETVRTIRRNAATVSSPKLSAALYAKASTVAKLDLADLRASYQDERVRDIRDARMFALTTAIPGIVRLTAVT